MKKIGFIGCGNIASAIFVGAVNSGIIIPENIYCYDLDSSKLAEFTKKGGMALNSAKEVAAASDILFLTVKPQVFKGVIDEIKTDVTDDTLIVTPAAGIKISKVREFFGFNIKTVRVMPNTPLMYSAGATAIVKGEGVKEEEFRLVKDIFSACGVVAEVEEPMIDAVTGISGSSPAFFMRFAREIISSGVGQGMNLKDAENLVIQTMLGTAKMVMESEKSIDELISGVASPNGTTEAGLKTMDRLDFDNITKEIIDSAINRSKELGIKS